MKKLLLLVLLVPCTAFAKLSDEQAIRAIVGEASNQGFEGMKAVACALRNRDSLKGVYGLNAKHIRHESKKTWDLARRAWAESATRDITGGAVAWDNVKAFGTPRWASDFTVTVIIKDHVFYKRIVKG